MGQVIIYFVFSRRRYLPCFSEIQIGFTFLVPAHHKGPLNGVCVCVFLVAERRLVK